ncbi:MAG: anti-sigma-I factor RsgI family protein [Clostridium sp.]
MDKEILDMLNELSPEDATTLLNGIEIEKIPKETKNSIKELTLKKLSLNTSPKRKNTFFSSIFSKRNIVFLLIFSILSIGFAFMLPREKVAVAYVSFDINPSIEMGLDKDNKVIKYTSVNNDGIKLIGEKPPLNVSVNESIDYLVQNAIDEGYITSDGTSTIALSATSDDEILSNSLENSITDSANKALNRNGVNCNIEGGIASSEKREEALSYGITPGKLNIIKKLQELDPSVKIEDYKDATIKEIQNKIHELKGIGNSNSNPPVSNNGNENNNGNGNGKVPNGNGSGNTNGNGNNNGNKPPSIVPEANENKETQNNNGNPNKAPNNGDGNGNGNQGKGPHNGNGNPNAGNPNPGNPNKKSN